MVVDMEENDVITRLSKLRPSPSYYVAHGSTATVIDVYKKAKSKKLVKRDARWTLVFHDWNYNRFDTSLLGDAKATFFTMGSEQCCIMLRKNGIVILDLKSLHCYFLTSAYP